MKGSSNMIINFILFLIIIISSLYAQPLSTSEINFIKKFPSSEDTVFLVQPTKLQLDEEKNIYVMDFRQNCILKFDSTGNFIQKIGKAGRGPGELNFASEFNYVNSKLFIYDSQNGRFQILDKSGNYLTSFKVFNTIISFFTNPLDERVYAVLASDVNTFLPFEPALFTIISPTGEVKKGFGEYLFSDKNITSYLSDCFIRYYNNKIYVLYKYYSILQIYSLSGELSNQFELNAPDYLKNIEPNYKWERLQKNQTGYSVRFLFTSFEVNQKGIFVGLLNDNLVIDFYNHHGQFKKRFFKKYDNNKENQFHLQDFKVMNIKDNTLKLLVLITEELDTIAICKIML